jgi:hypothetical protein
MARFVDARLCEKAVLLNEMTKYVAVPQDLATEASRLCFSGLCWIDATKTQAATPKNASRQNLLRIPGD